MFKLIPFDQVKSRHIRQFEAYWQTKRGGRTMPRRRDIDPAELKPILPWMLVVEIEPDPFRVLYRLAGTKVVEMNGIELTGRYLDSLDDEGANFTAQGIAAYHQVWTSQQPVYGSYRWPTQSGAEYLVEFAIFPVEEPGTDGQCIALEDWEIERKLSARDERPLPYVRNPARKGPTGGAGR
ncbi:MAG TPA: PAS domain-containing protein [Terriglobales bacterium]|nr:PAS domain-containing protein [Terriglobales bacterium]